jgi:hypothetical protein
VSALISRARAYGLALVWLLSVAGLFAAPAWTQTLAVVLLVLYLASVVSELRRETLIVTLFIALLTGLLVAFDGDLGSAATGLERTLLFAALLPTLRLVRATARGLPPVLATQERLAALPPRRADVGIVLGAHVFGSMLNTGAFAIMSAVVPDDAAAPRRRAAAQAALRGMNIAILWSPFFVGFAVAVTYVPGVPAWQIMSLGLALVCGAVVVGLLMFARPIEPGAIPVVLTCLMPIAPTMFIAIGAVAVCGLMTGLTALASVIVVMPVLCAGAWLLVGARVPAVLDETWRGMRHMGDDLLLITAAMTLGTVAENAPALQGALASLVGDNLTAPAILALLVFSMLIPAVIGIHPMITGSVMLAALSALPLAVSDLALMEAMLVGWALGSMVSISSLSVVTSGAMFSTPPLKLAYGPNLPYAIVVAAFAVVVLSLVDFVLRS